MMHQEPKGGVINWPSYPNSLAAFGFEAFNRGDHARRLMAECGSTGDLPVPSNYDRYVIHIKTDDSRMNRQGWPSLSVSFFVQATVWRPFPGKSFGREFRQLV
jgi:hypothetical protein